MRRRHRALLAAEVVIAYLPLRRRLRSNDLPAMVRLARDVSRASTPPSSDEALLHGLRLGYIVQKVLGRLPTDNRCLILSLVLLRLLERRGIESTMVIGVREAEVFGAHAWVERSGIPLLPRGDYERMLEM